jgi:hypothetical protein
MYRLYMPVLRNVLLIGYLNIKLLSFVYVRTRVRKVKLGLVLKVLKFYMSLFFLFAGVSLLSIFLFHSC